MKEQVMLTMADVIKEDNYIIFMSAGVDVWRDEGYAYEVIAYELIRYPHPEHGEALTHPYNYLNAGVRPIKQRRHYCFRTMDAACEAAQREVDEWVPKLEAMYAGDEKQETAWSNQGVRQ